MREIELKKIEKLDDYNEKQKEISVERNQIEKTKKIIDNELNEREQKLREKIDKFKSSNKKLKTSQKRLLSLAKDMDKSMEIIRNYESLIMSNNGNNDNASLLSQSTASLFKTKRVVYNHQPSLEQMKKVRFAYNLILKKYGSQKELSPSIGGVYNKKIGHKISSGADKVLQACERFITGEGTYGQFLLAVKYGMAEEVSENLLKSKSKSNWRGRTLQTEKLYEAIVKNTFENGRISKRQSTLMHIDTINTLYENNCLGVTAHPYFR